VRNEPTKTVSSDTGAGNQVDEREPSGAYRIFAATSKNNAG
jgi:hypothetical protein